MTTSPPVSTPRHGRALAALAIAAALAAGASTRAAAEAACTAQSGPTVPAVVELYTSEGCSSCPPAELWLSQLKGRDGVVTLAFHVDYWDSLGWKDRFAQPQFTQRQNASQRSSGARFAYTPQVILDSRDRRWLIQRREREGIPEHLADTRCLPVADQPVLDRLARRCRQQWG